MVNRRVIRVATLFVGLAAVARTGVADAAITARFQTNKGLSIVKGDSALIRETVIHVPWPVQ